MIRQRKVNIEISDKEEMRIQGNIITKKDTIKTIKYIKTAARKSVKYILQQPIRKYTMTQSKESTPCYTDPTT